MQMFNRKEFISYIGTKNGNSYVEGLANIEKIYNINIDVEYRKDKCLSLFQKIKQDKESTGLLKKYVNYYENSTAMEQHKQFISWMQNQPRKNDSTKKYKLKTITDAARKLQSGLKKLDILKYSEVNCFTITDPAYFAELYKTCYEKATEFDKNQGHRDFRNGLDFYMQFLNEQNNVNSTSSTNMIDLSHIPAKSKENKKMPRNIQKTDISKNTILYGPPGTGKTYNTIVYAVAIIENKLLSDIKKENYPEVLKRYNTYKKNGLIEFTTFHQSYGYEEFIEGIKPVIDNSEYDNNNIEYSIEDGLFKAFCNKSAMSATMKTNLDLGLNKMPTIWKVSLFSTGDNPTRTECLENGHIRIGWHEYGPDITADTDFTKRGGKNVLNSFIYKMKVGDIVFSCYSNTTIDAIGIVTGEYEWCDKQFKDGLNRLRNVNWIVKGINEDIVEINGGSTMTRPAVYKLKVSLSDALSLIQKYSPSMVQTDEKSNYVFIIDEINRGNISKIFGELITLIEPSKRIEQPEGMRVKLPYSQQLFGVPDNVYILGTMNTADRSIATIDTALRRSFRFNEMLPDANVLNGINVNNISVSEMLIRMNERISFLYDREHTIGHAYFIPLRNNPTIEQLAEIFKNAIIPLLQEYFYEDYEKIRLVLGDNNKENKEEQFIIAVENNYNKLFGNADIDFDSSVTYEINRTAFDNIEAYRSI